MTRLGAIATGTNINQWRREADFANALGVTVGETWSGSNCAGSTTQTSQAIRGTGVYLYSGEVITNLYVAVAAAATGAAPTLFKFGIWRKSTDACVAVSAEMKDSANWTSVGVQTVPVSYTVPADGVYYLASLMNGSFGGTALQLNSGTVTAGHSTAIGANPRRNATLGTGKTDMAVADAASYTALAAPNWFGWS